VAVMRGICRSASNRATNDTEQGPAPAPVQISTGRWAWEWIKSLLIALGLFLIMRTFLVEAFRIPTGSMENTLLVGDFLLVNKAAFGTRIPGTGARMPALSEPRRGDVIVFVPPHDGGKNFVKRLVGLPGDTLEMLGGTLYLNGRPQDEPYTRHSDPRDSYSSSMMWQCEYTFRTGDCRPTRDTWGPVVVPAGRFFTLGDNRDDSEDSRYWGFVERTAIKGRPFRIYYSFDPRSPDALPWLTGIRWERIGRRVH
jgi:signal peptidase I